MQIAREQGAFLEWLTRLVEDARFDTVLLALGDGLTLLRRR